MNHLRLACQKATVPGAILEFGVWHAQTTEVIAKMFANRTVWGFDSFEGLPDVWNICLDNGAKICAPPGTFSLDSKLPKVSPNVQLIKGWFEDTLPVWLQQHADHASFVHIDADLYSSCITVLNLLNQRIVPGTVIVFDEMYCWNNPSGYDQWENGEYRALREWLHEHDREFEPLYRTNHWQCSIRIVK